MQATQRGKNERIFSMGAKILSKPRSSFKECDKEKKKFRKERCRDSEFLEYLTCPARETLLKSLKLKGHEVDTKVKKEPKKASASDLCVTLIRELTTSARTLI